MTDVEPIVMRVARAICAVDYAGRFSKPVDHEHVQANVAGNWHRYIDEAKAAISAMREPTAAMVKAIVWDHDVTGIVYLRGPDAWRIMIDEALKEDPLTSARPDQQ